MSAVSSSRNLSVSWAAPTVGGSAVTGYELRYYAGSSDPDDEADWVLRNESNGGIPSLGTNTGTSATLTGLAASTAYRVQVRATNGVVWGPWSPSGTGTTNNSSSTTNRAPIRMKLGPTPADGCVEKTEDTAFEHVLEVKIGTLVGIRNAQDSGQCSSTGSRYATMFRDPDGDTLTITAQVRGDLPENVRLGIDIPFAHSNGNQIFVFALAAYRKTDFEVDVTATDPHGASVSTYFTARVDAIPDNNGAPRFEAQAESLSFTKNEAIEPVVLPAATGGDVGRADSLHGDIWFPYDLRGDRPAAGARIRRGDPHALGHADPGRDLLRDLHGGGRRRRSRTGRTRRGRPSGSRSRAGRRSSGCGSSRSRSSIRTATARTTPTSRAGRS